MILIIAFGVILGILGWKFLKWSVKTAFWIFAVCFVLSLLINAVKWLAHHLIVGIPVGIVVLVFVIGLIGSTLENRKKAKQAAATGSTPDQE
jgi:predicted cation transporter